MLNRSTFLILLVCSLFSGCLDNKQNKPESHSKNEKIKKPENIVGGWSQAEINDEVRKAANFARQELKATAEIKEISDAKTQIVSGKNYDVTFTLKNGEKWNVIVYRNVRNEYKLIKSTKLSL